MPQYGTTSQKERGRTPKRQSKTSKKRGRTCSTRRPRGGHGPIAKPSSPDLLHCLIVHGTGEEPNELSFTRCQRRSENEAVKRLKGRNPNAKDLYRAGCVPNGVNVLNCAKDWLKKKGVLFSARNNTIRLSNGSDAKRLIEYVVSIVEKVEPVEETENDNNKKMKPSVDESDEN